MKTPKNKANGDSGGTQKRANTPTSTLRWKEKFRSGKKAPKKSLCAFGSFRRFYFPQIYHLWEKPTRPSGASPAGVWMRFRRRELLSSIESWISWCIDLENCSADLFQATLITKKKKKKKKEKYHVPSLHVIIRTIRFFRGQFLHRQLGDRKTNWNMNFEVSFFNPAHESKWPSFQEGGSDLAGLF